MEITYNNHKYELAELHEPNSNTTFDIIAIFELTEDKDIDLEENEGPYYKLGNFVNYFYGTDEDMYSAALLYIKDYENEYEYEGEEPQWKGCQKGKTEHTGVYSITYIDKGGSSQSELVNEKELDKRLGDLARQECHDFCIAEAEKEEPKRNIESSEDHYCDGFVEVLNAKNLCMWVMTNTHGESKAIAYDDNFYTPSDLLEAYRKLTKEDNAPEEDFRKWLLTDCGCEPELLED